MHVRRGPSRIPKGEGFSFRRYMGVWEGVYRSCSPIYLFFLPSPPVEMFVHPGACGPRGPGSGTPQGPEDSVAFWASTVTSRPETLVFLRFLL